LNIALITARIGSTRLPKKNILDFCGIPLVAWEIIQAKCSKNIDDVYITTDSKEIADIAKQYGSKVIIRPILDNDITASYVLKLAVNEIEKQGITIDNIIYMLPTSPIKYPYDLDKMIEEFIRLKVNELGTYAINKETYIFRNLNGDDISTYLENIISDKNWNYSSQCGGWGIGKKEYLMDKWESEGMLDSIIDNNLMKNVGNKIYGYNVEPWQCFETDYADTFKLCELIMEQFILKGRGIKVYEDYAYLRGKDIKFDNNKYLDFSQYIGNINQL
jgi:CMP-N-acetylneuraminic acid synthetase